MGNFERYIALTQAASVCIQDLGKLIDESMNDLPVSFLAGVDAAMRRYAMAGLELMPDGDEKDIRTLTDFLYGDGA
jgi:hypothetical protein